MSSLPWYHRTSIYQIYPRSFFDSNGDGIGDLQGMIAKLDYLQDLGFETLWSSPFFASPQADFGYDISDYTSIAPEYGSMEDAAQLIEEVHRRGMRIVFDMVMNHTSSEHPWFRESRSSRDNPKADWYIWRDPAPSSMPGRDRGNAPNNWHSATGGSGWHYAEERKQYYWATFLPFQPDLNYRNPELKRTMLDIVRFWLARGVDGFRLDIFNYIFKDAQFRDNPLSWKFLPSEDDPSRLFQKAQFTVNLPESFEFAREFRSVCDEFGERLSIGEVSGNRSVIHRFLGDRGNNGLTLVFDFGMLDFKFSAEYFRRLIRTMEEQYPSPSMPVYVFSNHDQRRSLHRLGGDVRKAKVLHTLQLTVRGVPCMYYGEEIGMTNARLPFKTALDPIPHKYGFVPRFVFDALGITINRDEVRTPMQWDRARNAGFSMAEKTWLPVHENYDEVNVRSEMEDENSLLQTIRSLLRVRRQERALQEGTLALLQDLPKTVLGYVRSIGGEKVTVLLNFGESEKVLEAGGTDCIFRLTEESRWSGQTARLGSYGGLILKQ